MHYCNHCTCMLMYQAPPLQPTISPVGMHSVRTLALNTVQSHVALPEQAPIRRATLRRWLSPDCHVRNASQARLR